MPRWAIYFEGNSVDVKGNDADVKGLDGDVKGLDGDRSLVGAMHGFETATRRADRRQGGLVLKSKSRSKSFKSDKASSQHLEAMAAAEALEAHSDPATEARMKAEAAGRRRAQRETYCELVQRPTPPLRSLPSASKIAPLPCAPLAYLGEWLVATVASYALNVHTFCP
eukprot:1635021-Pyramimonas_sp.AAC.1